MRRVHARVQHGHDHAAAIEAASPRDVAADERHALWEERRLDPVLEDTVYPDRRPFELGERARVYLQRDERHVIVLVHHSIVVLVQPSQHIAADVRDVGALERGRRVREAPLGNVAPAGEPYLDEHARAVPASNVLPDLGRHGDARRVVLLVVVFLVVVFLVVVFLVVALVVALFVAVVVAGGGTQRPGRRDQRK